MNAAPILWQRPRPKAEPTGFVGRVEALHELLATIAGRHTHAALASSLSAEDVVLTHAIATLGAPIEVFVIDTGRLHRQTLALVAALERQFSTILRIHRPDGAAVARHVDAHGEFGFYDSLEVRKECCHLRKVEPLERALAGRDAWLTGQRRAHGPERARLAAQKSAMRRAASPSTTHWRFGVTTTCGTTPTGTSCRSTRCTRRATRRSAANRARGQCGRNEDPRAGRWWWEQGHTKECGLHAGPRYAKIPAPESV